MTLFIIRFLTGIVIGLAFYYIIKFITLRFLLLHINHNLWGSKFFRKIAWKRLVRPALNELIDDMSPMLAFMYSTRLVMEEHKWKDMFIKHGIKHFADNFYDVANSLTAVKKMNVERLRKEAYQVRKDASENHEC